MVHKGNHLISKDKQARKAKKTPKSRADKNDDCRAMLPKLRKEPNIYKQRQEFSDDDPPKVRPEGYKSPHQLIKEGDRVAIWWEGDDKYYRGTIRNIRGDGKHRVEYDDGQVVYHFLDREVFTMIEETLERFLAQCYPEDADKHENHYEPTHYPELVHLLNVGHTILVYWNSKNSWYPAVVTGKSDAGLFSILYDDDDRQLLRMENETFRFSRDSAAVVHTTLMQGITSRTCNVDNKEFV